MEVVITDLHGGLQFIDLLSDFSLKLPPLAAHLVADLGLTVAASLMFRVKCLQG